MRRKRGQGSGEGVTMKTIADEAGVTLTTVSRILNGKGDNYAAATKEKIQEIADRHRYRPNALVRGIQTGKTDTAGVVIPLEPYFSDIVRGIHEVFLFNETLMMLSWNDHSKQIPNEKLERDILHRLIDRRVDGFIISPSAESLAQNYIEEILPRNIPLVLVDRELEGVETDFVGSDDLNGGRRAAEYLFSLGHRNMAFAGEQDSAASSLREQGFRAILSDMSACNCGERLDPSDEEEAEGFLEQFRGKNPPTALFCSTDDLAVSAMNVLSLAGLKVPGDVSILGFGNAAWLQQELPLSSFDPDPMAMGRMAARLYIERVNGTGPKQLQQRRVPPTLQARSTTAPRS